MINKVKQQGNQKYLKLEHHIVRSEDSLIESIESVFEQLNAINQHDKQLLASVIADMLKVEREQIAKEGLQFMSMREWFDELGIFESDALFIKVEAQFNEFWEQLKNDIESGNVYQLAVVTNMLRLLKENARIFQSGKAYRLIERKFDELERSRKLN